MRRKITFKSFTSIGIISLVLLMAMLASMVGCGGTAETVTTTKTEVETATETEVIEPITLVFTSHDPGHGKYAADFFKPWFDEIEKRTGGRVKIEAHFDGELVGMMEAFDAVKKGTVDIANFMTTSMVGRFPMTSVWNIGAYDILNYHSGRVLWELFNKYPEMQAEFSGTKVLHIGTLYFTGFGTAKKPVRTLEDCEGVKFITVSEVAGYRGELLGWVPTDLPPQDVFSALQTGVIDGVGGHLMSLRDWGWGEPISYVTMIRNCASAPVFATVMNIDKWNSLPADVQKIMEDMIPELLDNFDEVEIKTFRELYANPTPELEGIEYIYLSPEEMARWVEADEPRIEWYIGMLEDQGLPGRQFVEEFLELDSKNSVPLSEEALATAPYS
jgi:TRAP-type C4-dicarboxylate transport system substrate-binding protein